MLRIFAAGYITGVTQAFLGRWLGAAFVACALTFGSHVASAGPLLFSATAGTFGGPNESISNSTTPVLLSSASSGTAGLLQATAHSIPVSIGAEATFTGSGYGWARGLASLHFSDLFVSGSDPTVEFVDATLRLKLTFDDGSRPAGAVGSGGLMTSLGPTGYSRAYAAVNWLVTMSSGGISAGEHRGSASVCSTSSPGNSGGLPGPVCSDFLVLTSTFDVESSDLNLGFRLPVNRQINGSINLGVDVSAAMLQSIGSAWAMYNNTLAFPQGTSVFLLPDGFTANSESLGIVNNVIGPVAEVPEPASLLLLGTALTGLALRRRRAT